MKTASEDLRHEHEAGLISLNVIEKIVENIRKNQEADVMDIKDIIEFLKVFADKCHHGKEEGYFFPALEKLGIPNQHGPIGVMLSEHQQGRNFIQQMQESMANHIINKNAFTRSASSYVNLLRNHIEKENNILFPMGDSKLSESSQNELLANFEDHEKKVIGGGKHEQFHALLKKLQKKYLN
jgi:hemerythrin-like domain-containing protein